MRTLRVLLCLILVAESTTYGLLSPLLPELTSALDLPEAKAGMITGAYTAGMLPACLIQILRRRAPSPTVAVLCGVASLTLGCLALANVQTFGGVLLGRALMGFGAAFCFGGATRWLVSTAPGREAFYFGLGWGMLSLGTAIGPGVGAVAVAVGARPVHNSLAGLFFLSGVLLATLVRTAPEGARTRSAEPAVAVADLLRHGSIHVALLPLVVPALAMGVLFTLVPLDLATADHRAWIAPTFLVAALVGAVAGPGLGRLLAFLPDRVMLSASLWCTAIALLVPTLLSTAVALAAVAIFVLGLSNQGVVVPAGETLRKVGDQLGTTGAASTLLPLMFAVFETVGAVASTWVATAGQDAPYIAVAVSCLLCLAAIGRRSTAEVPSTLPSAGGNRDRTHSM